MRGCPQALLGLGRKGPRSILHSRHSGHLCHKRAPHAKRARDTSESRSDHAGLAGGDRNRWPARHPALWRRACAPNCKSSTGDCPGSPDGTLSGGTAYSQAASTQSAAQGDSLHKTGIERPEVPAQYPLPPRRLAEADQCVVGPLARPSAFARDFGVVQKTPSSPPLISPNEYGNQFQSKW